MAKTVILLWLRGAMAECSDLPGRVHSAAMIEPKAGISLNSWIRCQIDATGDNDAGGPVGRGTLFDFNDNVT